MSQRTVTQKLLIPFISLGLFIVAAAQRPITMVKPLSSSTIKMSLADHLFAKLDPVFTGYKLLFELHHLGDLEGNHLPLQAYDMPCILTILKTIDTLLPQTTLTALLAASYFSYSPVPEHVRQLSLYLADYSAPNLQNRWPWLLHALYLSCKRLGAVSLAQSLAAPLRHIQVHPMYAWVKTIPVWLQQDGACKTHSSAQD
jgi:hypothetical protein